MAGQTINDRFLAARHSIAGQGLAKAVCKATTEELIAPKKKHLDYLIHCTNEPNVSIPQMATLLIERSQNTNWVVVYKSLITTHHLMCYGNERFTQYMASSNSTFQLSSFLDKSSIQGHDMSPFIRRYARYLNEKALSYRTVAFDFCKVKRGKDDGMLRTMNSDKLLKTLPALQGQIDALLEFNCNSNDLTNSVINICFMLLFRDLIRLFACYNDAIINLLEKFFDMNKKQAREALELYKKFLVRMDLVGDFLKVAEYIGIDKGDIPDLTKAPSSLLDALEQHLASIEGKKSTMSQSANNARNFKSGVTALSSTSNAFGTAATNSHTDSVNGFAPAFEADEAMLRHVIVEEEEVLNKYKSKIKSPSNGSMVSMQNNPFMSPTGSTERVISPPRPVADLFAPMPAKPFSPNPSDDLLQLGNPFVDAFDAAPVKPQLSLQMPQQVAPQQNNIWMNNGFMPQQQQTPTPTNNGNSFVSESSFQTVFGNSEQVGFDALGNVMQPASSTSNSQSSKNQQNAGNGVLTGDLESSLASLAENLTINRTVPKSVVWNSPKNGSNWTPQPMASTTGVGYRPMGQGINSSTSPPIMPPSPYQPHLTVQGGRPGMLPTMVPGAMPGMAGYPASVGMVPQPMMSPTNTVMPQQSHQQSLLFH